MGLKKLASPIVAACPHLGSRAAHHLAGLGRDENFCAVGGGALHPGPSQSCGGGAGVGLWRPQPAAARFLKRLTAHRLFRALKHKVSGDHGHNNIVPAAQPMLFSITERVPCFNAMFACLQVLSSGGRWDTGGLGGPLVWRSQATAAICVVIWRACVDQ
jgi:hypothetical protein